MRGYRASSFSAVCAAAVVGILLLSSLTAAAMTVEQVLAAAKDSIDNPPAQTLLDVVLRPFMSDTCQVIIWG